MNAIYIKSTLRMTQHHREASRKLFSRQLPLPHQCSSWWPWLHFGIPWLPTVSFPKPSFISPFLRNSQHCCSPSRSPLPFPVSCKGKHWYTVERNNLSDALQPCCFVILNLLHDPGNSTDHLDCRLGLVHQNVLRACECSPQGYPILPAESQPLGEGWDSAF